MSIDREEVKRIAALARLALPEASIDRTARELSEVLDFVAALRRLELEGCEPMTFAPREAPWRADEPDGRRLTPEQALAMAPETDGFFFLVPPIVENVNP
jgi:aspartyl-tRNA(Asn)/glutamyl-tRNA(Gln) amidotransferase subunit C